MSAGLDVLVEKPIASTIQDAEAMIDASRNAGKTLMVGFNQRFDPIVIFLHHTADIDRV